MQYRKLQRRINPLALKAGIWAGIYLLFAFVSYKISFPTASFPTIWLPSGLFVATLLLTPYRDWPVYMAAAIPGSLLFPFLNSSSSTPLLYSVIDLITICIEASTGVWLIRQFHPAQNFKFDGPRDVFLLVVLAAMGGCAISATINTLVRVTLDEANFFWDIWRIAWYSHEIGVLTVAPFILTWMDFTFDRKQFLAPGRIIEAAVLFSALLACALYVFGSSVLFLGQGFLVIPFLVWAALRYGPRGTSLSNLLVALIATWGIVQQLNGFAYRDATIAPSLVNLGSFLTIIIITCLFLATIWKNGQQVASELRQSEARYRLLFETQGDGVVILNLNEDFLFVNPAANQIFGVFSQSLVGRNLKEFTSPALHEMVRQQTLLCEKGVKTSYELEITQPSAETRNLWVTATPDINAEGKVVGVFAIFRDFTERKQAELALRDSQARYQTLFDHSPIPIWEEDFSEVKKLLDQLRDQGVQDLREYFRQSPDALEAITRKIRVLNVNQATLLLLNIPSKTEFMGQVKNILDRGPQDMLLEEVLAIANGLSEFEGEGPNDLVNGTIRYHHIWWSVAPGYEHDYSRVIVSILDITERKRTEESLRYLSTHDLLTGLYNRNFFEAELERLQGSRQQPINMMVVDVNSMKHVNDTYGHAAGDELLKRTAQVLKTAFRKEDVIARIGGDEFVVLFTGGAFSNTEAVRRVSDALDEHNNWCDNMPLSLSIGTATGSKDTSLLDIFRKADQQMYKDKVHSRKNRLE